MSEEFARRAERVPNNQSKEMFSRKPLISTICFVPEANSFVLSNPGCDRIFVSSFHKLSK